MVLLSSPIRVSPLQPVDHTYRVPPERITELNELLAIYKGTHNFYNFTSTRGPEDKSNMRLVVILRCCF